MAESSSRRGILIGLGVLVIVVGLAAAVALWIIGGDRRRDAVETFARAPVGCDTTLDFVETGDYFVYIERAGRLDGIRGDCDVEGTYDVGSAPLDPVITIVDPDGDLVEPADSVTELEYSEGGFVGVAAFTIDITQTDDHVVRVESPDDEVFAVAIGRDPNDGVAALRAVAAAAGILGVFLGAMLMLLGARSARAKVPAQQWAPGVIGQPTTFVPGGTPQGPPVYGQHAGPPQYARPGPPPPGPPTMPGQPPQFGQPPPPQSREGGPFAAPEWRPAPGSGQPQVPGQPGWGPAVQPPAPPPVVPDDTQPDERAPQSSDDATAARAEERPPPPPPS